MPPARPDSIYPTPEAELVALRAEAKHLRAAQAQATGHEYLSALYQESQVRFRTVFEESPLGNKIIDSDLRIRQANPALAQLLGLASPAEAVGRRIMEFAHPSHRHDWELLQQRLWHDGLPSFVLETQIRRPDGTAVWCQVTSVLFHDEEGPMGYTSLEDITARKESEGELERVYNAQETVLHLIVHDLKNPVAQVQLLIDLLGRDLLAADAPAPPPDTARYLQLIDQACAQATALLRDVLVLGELDTRGLQKETLDLGALVEQLLPVHRLMAGQHGHALAYARPAQPLNARVNAHQFARVLTNLLTNACKFTPRGGTITVGLRQEDGRPLLTVQDTGVGIPAALHEHLFDKFSAAARQGLHQESPTGLGLFITRQIVQRHGGRIWMESVEGLGTTFFVELP